MCLTLYHVAMAKLRLSIAATLGVNALTFLDAADLLVENHRMTIVRMYSIRGIIGYSRAVDSATFSDSARFLVMMLYLLPVKCALAQGSRPILVK